MALEWNGLMRYSYFESSEGLSKLTLTFMIWLFSVVKTMQSSVLERDMHLILADIMPA
jgi:hypothetical protein